MVNHISPNKTYFEYDNKGKNLDNLDKFNKTVYKLFNGKKIVFIKLASGELTYKEKNWQLKGCAKVCAILRLIVLFPIYMFTIPLKARSKENRAKAAELNQIIQNKQKEENDRKVEEGRGLQNQLEDEEKAKRLAINGVAQKLLSSSGSSNSGKAPKKEGQKDTSADKEQVQPETHPPQEIPEPPTPFLEIVIDKIQDTVAEKTKDAPLVEPPIEVMIVPVPLYDPAQLLVVDLSDPTPKLPASPVAAVR